MFQSAVIRDEYEFTAHNSALTAVCYNRHQDTFVSVDEVCVRLWRASGGQLRHVNLPARTARFIQTITYIDARQVFAASALDGALRLFDPNLNELAALFTGRGTVLTMVFDGAHNRLLTGGVDGCMAWQIKPRPTGMPEGAFNPHYEFTPLPKFFSLASRKRPIATKETKASKASTERSGWVESLQLNSESNRLYAQTKHWIDVFSTADGSHIERYDTLFPAEHGTLTAFVVQERAKYLVCGTSSGVIVALSCNPLSVVHIFKDHTQTITSLTEHATSRLLVSSSLDGTVRLWDIEARRQAHRLNVGSAVHALQLLPPASAPQAAGSKPRAGEVEMAGRFCCQLRNTVRIYNIQSILKEHQPCHVPVSILQRVLFPVKAVHGQQSIMEPSRQRIEEEINDYSIDSEEDEEGNDDAAIKTPTKLQQLVLVACMDKTLRVFAGRTANEAPSFTWIPDEQSLDLVSFALHPVSNHLFLLLNSQKLLIINAAPRKRSEAAFDEATSSPDEICSTNAETEMHEKPEATTSTIDRVVSLSLSTTAQKLSNPTASLEDQDDDTKNGSLIDDTASISMGENSTSPTRNKGGNSGGGAALRCICVCPFPPLFQTAFSPTDAQSPRRRRSSAGGSTSRRRQSQFTPTPQAPPVPQRRNALVHSEWEWMAFGSDLGQLIFWHTGLRAGREAALTLEAHDASIIDISASASSPIVVSLDASARVHVWSLQPTFALRHVLELGQPPSVFAFSPLSEIILSGFDDGHVTFHSLGYRANCVEAFTGGDDHHSTTVSAGDFLDERSLVLTVSVDAIVKVWDQRRCLLRQVTLATAVTSLCFLNADGDLLAGLTKGTFVISRRDVLPDKLPKPAPRPRTRNGIIDSGAEHIGRIDSRDSRASPPKPASPEHLSSLTDGASAADSSDKKSLVVPRPRSPESNAKQLFAHVIQRPIEASNQLRPPVLRNLSSGRRRRTTHITSRGNNNNEQRQTISSMYTPRGDQQEEDWRDKILPLSAYQKLLRDPQRSSSYRRKRSQVPSSPLILQSLMPSPRVSNTKTQSARRDSDATSEGSAESSQLGLGADAPLLYCKHQAPVPPKDKTPRKLWNAIGGEDRRLIVLQRSRLPPC